MTGTIINKSLKMKLLRLKDKGHGIIIGKLVARVIVMKRVRKWVGQAC